MVGGKNIAVILVTVLKNMKAQKLLYMLKSIIYGPFRVIVVLKVLSSRRIKIFTRIIK